ncbi:uncharacterized protein [Dermacentor albipictus]|uniref:uncharacterized protein isoform X1 n=1 Tax=Dermacentor albipictus TaxID=60249 RepID=UPI0038FC9C1B
MKRAWSSRSRASSCVGGGIEGLLGSFSLLPAILSAQESCGDCWSWRRRDDERDVLERRTLERSASRSGVREMCCCRDAGGLNASGRTPQTTGSCTLIMRRPTVPSSSPTSRFKQGCQRSPSPRTARTWLPPTFFRFHA